MNKYTRYSAKDFVNDLRFRSWVRHPSPEEDLNWKEWIQTHPDKRDVVTEARAIVLAIHPVHDDVISEEELNDSIAGIMAHINNERPGRVRRLVLVPAAAAVVVVVLIAGWYLKDAATIERAASNMDATTASLPERYMIERINKGDDDLLISLPDNSSVLLARNSTLRYPRAFDEDSREIILKGTAFFEITKDPARPFYVNAGKVIAKVLGTSFEITDDEALGEVSVVVKSGTVSIYSHDDDEGMIDTDNEPNVILTEHEHFIFRDKVGQIQHTRLDSISIEELNVPDTYLTFSASPASEVLTRLASVYDVKIDYANADIDGCSVTASFTDEPFSLKLQLICRSIGVEYEVLNDHVIITGIGCKN